MADPVGTADLYCLPDGLKSEGLSCVDCNVEVLAPDIPEGLYVLLRRMAVFITCDVEGDNAPVREGNSEFSYLKCAGGVLVAHRTEYQAVLDARPAPSPVKPGQHCGHDFLQVEPLFCVKIRCEAQLRVDDVLLRKIFHGLTGDALEVLLRLHDCSRICEGFQVQGEAFLLAAPDEPVPELSRIRAGQLYSVPGCQVYDCLNPESSVQVVVEFHLGNSPNHLTCNHAEIIEDID